MDTLPLSHNRNRILDRAACRIAAAFALACFAVALSGQVRIIDPPAGPDSGMPFLAASSRGVYMSWLEPAASGQHSLKVAEWTAERWSTPGTIAFGPNWFINWADFPSIIETTHGMLAHWLTRTGPGKWGYGIRFGMAETFDKPWHETYTVGLMNPDDYSGFVSFVSTRDSVGAAYLAPPVSGRGRSEAEQEIKTLRFVDFRADGSALDDEELDSDVCTCCQTAVAMTAEGVIVVYRDHLQGEIRDISTVRRVRGAWTSPHLVHRDGWRINGCPSDGPSIAASGDRVAVAWLTRAQDRPRIQLSFSTDSGRTFIDPVRIDDGSPLGRVSLANLDRDSVVACWIEKTGDATAQIRLKQVSRSSGAQSSITVASVPASRAVGLPKIAILADRIIVAWRDSRVRAAWLPLSELTGAGK